MSTKTFTIGDATVTCSALPPSGNAVQLRDDSWLRRKTSPLDRFNKSLIDDDERVEPKKAKKKCHKCGGIDWNDIHQGVGDCCIKKALPKKDTSSTSAKKPKQSKANKQQAGKTGKVRSSYPNETSGKPAKPIDQRPQRKQNPAQVPQQEEEGPPIANPGDLANMLGMPVTSLQRIAHRFRDKHALGGRSGFVTFMKTRLKPMARKHKLDGDYFGLVFDALCPKKPNA